MSPFRLFEVTIQVHIPRNGELPHYAADWLEVITGASQEHFGATGASLVGIRELRYPLADDVVEKRKEDDRRYW